VVLNRLFEFMRYAVGVLKVSDGLGAVAVDNRVAAEQNPTVQAYLRIRDRVIDDLWLAIGGSVAGSMFAVAVMGHCLLLLAGGRL
jgi:hypothetical protein